MSGTVLPDQTLGFHHIYNRIWMDLSPAQSSKMSLMVWACLPGEEATPTTTTSPVTAAYQSCYDRWGRRWAGGYKTVMVRLVRSLRHVFLVLEGVKQRKNKDAPWEKCQEFAHIKKRVAVRNAGSQYSSCSSCWPSGPSSCWFPSFSSPSANSARSFRRKKGKTVTQSRNLSTCDHIQRLSSSHSGINMMSSPKTNPLSWMFVPEDTHWPARQTRTGLPSVDQQTARFLHPAPDTEVLLLGVC